MTTRLTCAIVALLLPGLSLAQTNPDAWEADVRTFDSAYWQAFNSCDVPKLAQMNTEDLEFYHDKGGVSKGRAIFAATFGKNICGNPALRVRREAIPESIKVFPLRDGDKLYGAIVSGEHRFYRVPQGGPETVTGQAHFTHTLLLADGVWQVARVLSYDHGAPRR
jgi:hypothetical protein